MPDRLRIPRGRLGLACDRTLVVVVYVVVGAVVDAVAVVGLGLAYERTLFVVVVVVVASGGFFVAVVVVSPGLF